MASSDAADDEKYATHLLSHTRGCVMTFLNPENNFARIYEIK